MTPEGAGGAAQAVSRKAISSRCIIYYKIVVFRAMIVK
jgi:hypothetical protein